MKKLDPAKVEKMLAYVQKKLRLLESRFQAKNYRGMAQIFGEHAPLVLTKRQEVYQGMKRIENFWAGTRRRGITKVQFKNLKSVALPVDFLLVEKESVYAAYDFVLHVFGTYKLIAGTKRNDFVAFSVVAGHRVVCRGRILEGTLDC